MREIKFRAWDDFNREMIFPYLRIDEQGWIFSHRTNSPFVMQFTGLRDRNGREIYEGDVVRTPHFVSGKTTHYLFHVIEWSEKYAGWFARSTAAKHDSDGCVQMWVYAKNTGGGEIIGNIYENPELLVAA